MTSFFAPLERRRAYVEKVDLLDLVVGVARFSISATLSLGLGRATPTRRLGKSRLERFEPAPTPSPRKGVRPGYVDA